MIFKTTLTVIVLHEADSAEEAAQRIADEGLNGTAYEITDGEWIGMVVNGPTVEVPADKVESELIALGNDGTFFDDPLEREE